LRNNYLQSAALSLMERRAVEDLGEHQQLLRWLERHGEIDRAVELLPTDEEMEQRRRQGRGLTRPELALLFAYGKIALNHALTETGSAADPYLARELERYFPRAMQRRFAKRIKRHRLAKQIIITATTNSIVNRVGPTLLIQCSEASDANAAAIARAYTIARDSADLRTLWAQIEALDGRIRPADQYDALLETSRFLSYYTQWLLLHRREYGAVGAAVARLQPALRELAQVIPAALEGLDREHYLARSQRFAGQGFPPRVAESLAALAPLHAAPDMVALMASARARARAVARAHFGLGARLGLDWLHGAIDQLPASGSWQRAATLRLRDSALAAHLRISAAALSPDARRAPRAPAASVDDPALARWQQMQRDLHALAAPDLAALTVAVEALENLAAGRAHELVRLL
jgi:glutamate dehydrogenase